MSGSERASRQFASLWAAAALAGAAALPFSPKLAPLLPACPFHALTGWPCPTCGLTRACLALSRLDLSGALRLNPLGVLAVAAFVLGGLAAGVAAAAGRPWPVPSASSPRWRAAAIGLVAANWAWVAIQLR